MKWKLFAIIKLLGVLENIILFNFDNEFLTQNLLQPKLFAVLGLWYQKSPM